MATFFTSDTHFGHTGIIRWTKRPFANKQAMDKELIRRWNETVTSQDTVYHGGDFGFHSSEDELTPILKELKGKIHLVLGNHDFNPDIEKFSYCRFESIQNYLETEVQGQAIVICHYPLSEWNGSFANTWHLYGHSHNQWPVSQWKKLDIGVDGHDLRPWSFKEIEAVMNTRNRMTSSVYD